MAAVLGVANVESIVSFASRYPVFPCGPDKRPLVKTGFHAATQDEKQIRNWWRQWPDALVGVPTGQGTQLVVIDYDPDKATQATHSWISDHTDLLCSTRTHKTGRGGLHYLFKSADRYQTGVDLVLDGSPRKGIDLRANGGYVIWWPFHTGEKPSDQPAPVPADLIDERRFSEKRDMGPLPTACPSEWRSERARVESALRFLAPDGYEHWIRVGMALHHASGGSDEGFALWHEWSARGESYDGIEDCRYHWSSFGGYSGRALGLGTIYAAAKAAGFNMAPERQELPPIEAYEDDFARIGHTSDAEIEAPTPAEITATRYTWRDPSSIPPRPWIYGFHYMRGMVSSTAGAGGAGKSTLVIAELLSMVTGKDLLRGGAALVVGPQRVWYHNGEDPLDELDRRISAACLHYGLKESDLGGRLHVTSGRTTSVIVASDVQKTTVIHTPVRDALIAEMRARKVDVLSVDPFISTHNVGENDNTAMEQVMRVWRDIAEQTRAAVDLTHHFRKATGGEVSADELRGASAITGACRSVRVVAAMSQDEAAKAAIDPDERLRYLWCANPKGNMTIASTRKHWRFLESVCLDNASAPYPADQIGVAREWHYPEVRASDLNPVDIVAIKHALRMADPVTRCRVAPQSKHWAGFLVAEVLELDMSAPSTRNQVSSAIAALNRMGAIQQGEARDNIKRRTVPIWEPGEEQ